MPKTKISEFSATPGNNTDIDGINISEGCAPSGINDAIRELMSQLKDFQAGTAGDSFNGPVGTTTAAAGAFTTLSASGTVSGTGFSNYLASPPAIGGTTAAAGSFTTLSASSSVTLSGGTANGLAYLNNSKVLTTGNSLSFDGSNLTVFGSVSSGITGTAGTFILARSSDGAGTAVLESLAGTNNIGLRNTAGSLIFSANNAEGMRLTSTGLGIGTSSPAARLDVVNNSTYQLRVASGTGNYANGGIFLGSLGTSDAEYWGAIQYLQSDQTTRIVNKSYSAIGGIDFYIGTTGTPARAMKLDSFGNLGLGVTPSAWDSGFKVLQLGGGAYLGQYNNNAVQVGLNTYFNGTNYIYTTTNEASRFVQTDGQFQWFTAPSGTAGNAISFTQAMTLDASGNLGVGTTLPGSFGRLSVVGTIAPVSPDATIQGIYSAANTGEIRLGGFKSGGGTFLVFTTGADVERARIDSSGNLLVGTTTSEGVLTVVKTSGGSDTARFKQPSTSTGGYCVKTNAGNNGGTYYHAEWQAGTTPVGSITSNTTTTAYNTSSDYRLKENIAPMTGALAKVAALKPCTYKWKADGSDGEGFIAHEIAEVCPQAVTGEKDAVDAEGKPVYQGIDTSFLVATLTAAIQELKAEFDAYKATHP